MQTAPETTTINLYAQRTKVDDGEGGLLCHVVTGLEIPGEPRLEQHRYDDLNGPERQWQLRLHTPVARRVGAFFSAVMVEMNVDAWECHSFVSYAFGAEREIRKSDQFRHGYKIAGYGTSLGELQEGEPYLMVDSGEVGTHSIIGTSYPAVGPFYGSESAYPKFCLSILWENGHLALASSKKLMRIAGATLIRHIRYGEAE